MVQTITDVYIAGPIAESIRWYGMNCLLLQWLQDRLPAPEREQALQLLPIEQNPGIKVETTGFGNKYAFLDKEEIREKLIAFSEGGISKVKFFIPVIHCASCIWLLEKLHLLHPGIKHSFREFHPEGGGYHLR